MAKNIMVKFFIQVGNFPDISQSQIYENIAQVLAKSFTLEQMRVDWVSIGGNDFSLERRRK